MAAERRVAIVTGGGAGIGRAASLELARTGRAVLVVDLNGSAAESVAAEIRAANGIAATLECDISSESGWSGIVERAVKLGPLEALVSNAAVFPRLPIEETHAQDFDRVMAVNLRAPFLGAVACLPHLRETGGALVFMTSGSGLITAVSNPMQRGFSLYGASKAGLDRWALGIAPELAPAGVSVNLLCPGAPVLTEGYRKHNFSEEEAGTKTVAAEQVARAIAHLVGLRPPAGTGGRYVATAFGESWGVS
jgi:3-oxoacyl-[acyl-carrier protein] reductase